MIGVLASVVGAYYYLRIIKIMFFDEAKDKFEPVRFKAGAVMAAAALIMLFGVIWLGPFTDYAMAAAQSFTFAK